MVRQSTLSKIEEEMHKAWIEMASVCLFNSKHSNDIIVCSQNGSFDYSGHPMIGLGIDGFSAYQSLNHISLNGLKYLTNDDNCFKKQNHPYQPNNMEESIHFEMRQYLNIWENIYFLRVLTQLVNIGSGAHYDWGLSLKDMNSVKKSAYIRENIKQRLNSIFPLFSKLFNQSYIGQVRNAIAHSQYQVIQGGIIFNNYKSDKYSNLEGILFEKWEEIYCFSYWILYSTFMYLKNYKNGLSKISNLPHKAVEILTPDKNGNWYLSYIAPTEPNTDDWHFVDIRG